MENSLSLHFPEGIDSTMLSAFGSCEQKWFIEFCLRRAPIGKSIDLHAGGAIAKAFETIRIAYYRDKKSEEEAIFLGFQQFLLSWGTMETKEGSYKDFVNCWGAVEAYFRQYPMATDYFQPYMKQDGSPAVEFRFAIPMQVMHPDTNNPIMFCGRADQISTNDPFSCYVQDEKTTKALGTSWYYQWDMRGQFYGYTYAAREYGFPCAGALVRGIAIQQTQYGFAEKILFYTDDQLNDWWYMANERVARMVYAYQNAKAALQNPNFYDETLRLQYVHRQFQKSYGDACASYGGCQYVDLCTKAEPWKLYQHYEQRVWDPLAHDPTANSEDRISQMETQLLSDMMGE